MDYGCNSAFISLIPKKTDPISFLDYHPICLIGCMSKVISKFLASRLKIVIASIVGDEQSAYIKDRNILDGHLIVNEVISWINNAKKTCMLFKVDFDKAFDSVNWSYLDSILENLGFDSKWRFWILKLDIEACIHQNI